MFTELLSKLKEKAVLIRLGIAFTVSLLYGFLSGQFALRFIDGISIASVLYLFAGLLHYWWKEGFFSFFLWKKEEGPFITYREKVKEERKHLDNPSLTAGLVLLVIALVLTLLYSIV